MSAIQAREPQLRFHPFFFSAGAAGFAGGALGSNGPDGLSTESTHGRSCHAHLLELLGSAAHSEASSILHC